RIAACVSKVGRTRCRRGVDAKHSLARERVADAFHHIGRMRDWTRPCRCEQCRVHRALHFYAEHERCASRAHHENIETRQHADPDVDLEERAPEECVLRPIEERTQVLGVCRTLAVSCECLWSKTMRRLPTS